MLKTVFKWRQHNMIENTLKREDYLIILMSTISIDLMKIRFSIIIIFSKAPVA